MVLFLTGTLLFSVLGMSGIIATKRWENRTGRVLFAGVRPIIAERIHALLMLVLHTTPKHAHVTSRAAGRWTRHVARHAVASGMLWLEQKLEQLLHTIRHTATHREPAHAVSSPFLLEVAEYKKALMRRASSQQIAQLAEE